MLTALKKLIRWSGLYPVLFYLREKRRFVKFGDEEKKRVEFYSQFMHAGDVVFDVGANYGNRSKIFLKIGASVVAFEPQKLCVRFLQKMLGDRSDFTLVDKALGAKTGRSEMHVSDANTISTLSKDWIEATKGSGRFSNYEWDGRQEVDVITLDDAIGAYGKPTFIKVDVEGFEFEVLSGLTQLVDFMSIEFIPEYLDSTFQCIDHLTRLGKTQYQISFWESMEFELDDWVAADEVKAILSGIAPSVFGDLYIRRARSE